MINRLVNEIEIALKNELYLLALNTALTLPDICGKAEFPDKGNKRRYVDWCNKYVKSLYNNVDKSMPCLNAEIIYNLRCSLSHQGTPNIDKDLGIDRFVLTIQKNDFDLYFDVPFTIKHINSDKSENCYNVSLIGLCHRLCDAAKEYYNRNLKKFSFINYRIQDLDKDFELFKSLILTCFEEDK